MNARGGNSTENLAGSGTIEHVVTPRERDLGEFSVRRVLPSPRQRSVGPFVFFDHMGPADFPPGKGIAVRPHPHIGLATITYLFTGEIMHRDSLGFVQSIRPGAANLMTAGRGIVHSERSGEDLDEHSHLHGIQSWLALPADREEIEPAFEHTPADALPQLRVDGCSVRIIMGECCGARSPVTVYSQTLYLELRMPGAAAIELPTGQTELAFYVVSGRVSVDGRDYAPGVMPVVRRGQVPLIRAAEESRIMVVGGEPLGERHLDWNFVSSSRERIDKARADWREGRFGKVPGDDEFIPLPD